MQFSGRTTLRASALVGLLVATTSCAGAGSRASDYNFRCSDIPLLQLSLLDVSASGRDRDILGERLNAIQVDAERVSDCDGELVVVAWGGSASSSEILFGGQIPVSGASEIGRDRKIPEAVEAVMEEIRASLNDMLPLTEASGHDLMAAFSIVSDFVRSRSAQSDGISVHIYADGVATEGSAQINIAGINDARVAEIVAEQDLPDLTGVNIELFGVGRVGGDAEPPQQVVDTTLGYAQSLCEATGADCSTFSSTFSTD